MVSKWSFLDFGIQIQGFIHWLKQFTAVQAALKLRLNYYVGTFHDKPQ